MPEPTVGVVALGYHVVVELTSPEKTEGGIHLPSPGDSDQRWARVIAVGDGETDRATGRQIEIPLDHGDLVCIAPNRGKHVTIGKRHLMAIPYNEVLFALRGPNGEVMGDRVHELGLA